MFVAVSVVVAALAGGVAGTSRAAAQADGAGPADQVRAIVVDAADDDVYVEQAPVVAPDRLAELAARIATTDQRWAFVVLDRDLDNAKVLARDVLTELRSVTGEHTTVVVLTPTSIGAETVTEAYEERIDGALTEALPLLQRSPVSGMAAVFESLSGARLPGEAAAAGTADDGDDGGSSALPIAIGGLAIVVGAAVVVTVLRRR
jgi:hypothetical protein